MEELARTMVTDPVRVTIAPEEPAVERIVQKMFFVSKQNKVALLEEANLTPSIIDVDAFAMHNSLEINYPEAMKGIAGLVSIGHETTNVNILEDGVPVLTRDLSFGTRRLSLDLQRERGMLADEAEAVLRGESVDERLRNFLYERAQEVGRGIERATAFLETQEVGASLGKLYLCGGGVRVPGLVEALAERLSVETRVASSFEVLHVKPGAAEEERLDDLGPMMMLAVGLALRQAA